MFNIKIKAKNKKIAICLSFFGIFVFGLLLFFNNNKFDVLNTFNNNLWKNAFAAEEKPINCRKQTEIQLPFGQSARFGPNEFEIPTGEVTDKTEDVAKRILEQLVIMISAAEQESAEARELITLADGCGVSSCTAGGCQDCSGYRNAHCPGDPTSNCPVWQSCCTSASCGGQACPAGIGGKYSSIEGRKNVISNASDRIKNILTNWQPNKPVGNWWQPCAAEFPVVPGCLSERSFILAELERARSGDYEILGSTERRPPGLNDCVIRPQDMEEVLKGEKTGKYLFSCREAVIAGVIESNDCYGYNEGTEQNRQRAENYYCCE